MKTIQEKEISVHQDFKGNTIFAASLAEMLEEIWKGGKKKKLKEDEEMTGFNGIAQFRETRGDRKRDEVKKKEQVV